MSERSKKMVRIYSTYQAVNLKYILLSILNFHN